MASEKVHFFAQDAPQKGGVIEHCANPCFFHFVPRRHWQHSAATIDQALLYSNTI